MRYKVRKLAESKQTIHTKVTRCDINITFLVTFVYASNYESDRALLWNELSDYVDERARAQLVIGDLTMFSCPMKENMGSKLTLEK